MSLSDAEKKLLEDELKETRKRLESWVHRELDNPAHEGGGRNNQMIRLAPRMAELGWDRDGIFEKFKEIYDLDLDDSKDDEILRVVDNALRYAKEIVPTDPEEIARQKRDKELQQRQAARAFKLVMTKYAWPEAEIVNAGGFADMSPTEQRVNFLQTLFEPEDVIWCGNVWQSGTKRDGTTYVNNFRTVQRWLDGPSPAFEFLSHCTFKPGSFSRSNDNVVQRKYIVVESDELSRDEIGGVFSWLAHGGLQLRAVVFSGGKSLHGWFEWDDEIVIDSLSANLVGLKCDPSTLRPSQPVRLAGITRKDTHQVQRLLYLA